MSSAPRKPRIKVGVIGLGIIGSRVAANLRAAGHQVYVWSRSPHRAPNFLGSVVEVADLSDIIQVFVSDDAALLEVTRTIAAALSPRHVFASHATVSPGAARQAASIIEGQGARYLDAPFTGSKAAAQNRQLVYYVGGGREALEEIRPVLAASSKTILHVGGIGDASVLKIATNMVTASTVQTLAESLALVRAAGIPGQKLVEALENNGSRSGTSDMKLPAMIAQNFEPNFSLKHMLKDARLALNLADGLELSLPVTETTAEVLSLGMANGWDDQDFCCVTQLYPLPDAPESGTVSEAGTSAPDAMSDPGHGSAKVSGNVQPPNDPVATAEVADFPPAMGLPPSPVPAATEPGRAAFKESTKRALRVKESTLRALRGLFAPTAGKAKRPPAPPANSSNGADTILPTEGLPSGVAPTSEVPPPELEPARPEASTTVSPAPTPPARQDPPPEADRPATEAVAGVVLVPDR